MKVKYSKLFYSRMVSSFKSWLGSKYGYRSAVCFSYVLLAAVSLCLIDNQNTIIVMDDEFGYWGIAASLVGYDWYDLLALTDYYSFGYSILLVPLYLLRRLGIGMSLIYKLAIIMNGGFLLLSFKMANYVARKMFPNLNRYYSLLICLVTTLYVSNITWTQVAWSEACLYFMFWCVLVCLIKVLEEPRLKHVILLLLSAAYIFTVHMRALGVVVSVGMILMVFIVFNCRRFSGKKILFTFIISGILLLGIMLIKEWMVNYIYANNSYVATNDFSGQINKVTQSATTVTGLFSYLLSIFGKLYYLGVSSWGLAFLALAIILFKVFGITEKWIKSKRISFSTGEILFVFIGMASMAQICVTAMFKSFRYDSVDNWADTICYGRYTDFIIGPLLLIGFASLPEISKYIKEVLLSLLVLFICAVTVQNMFDLILSSYVASELLFRSVAVVGILYLFPDGVETGAYFPAFVSSFLFLTLVFVNMLEKTNRNIKRMGGAVALLLVVGSVWCGFGLKAAYELIGAKDKVKKPEISIQLLSELDKETDIYVIDANTLLENATKRNQWSFPNLSFQVITPEEFAAMNFDKETVYLSRGDNPSIIGMVSDSKKLVSYSNALCVYTEPGSKAEEVINGKLAEVYSGRSRIRGEVDLSAMLTDLSYLKYNGSLYYNFHRKEGYVTRGTELQLPDGIYEFTIDMEIPGLTENAEIGFITVTDAKDSYEETYLLKLMDFGASGQGKIKVQFRSEDYAEPIIGIYTYGNCSMKINNVSYQQTQGNIALEGEKADCIREIGEVVTCLKRYREMAICYVDSDSSALTGFPDFNKIENALPGKIAEIITGIIMPYKNNIGNRYYIVENTDNNEVLFNLVGRGYIAVYKNRAFTLLIPDENALRTSVAEQKLKILADGKTPIEADFFSETTDERTLLSEMSDISLPRGRYEVLVDFKIEEVGSIDAALIFLNGEEIKITREMLDENHYREVYELELTESSPNVRLGLFASRQSWITEEYIGVKRIGNCYGYIQKIPVYDLEWENAVCYADSIITDERAESSIGLQNFPLEFGEYMLTFTGQQTAGSGTAQIKIYRNGVLRTDEPLVFGEEGEQEFTFEMNEYEPAEWDFEIICPAGSRLKLSDFEIVR